LKTLGYGGKVESNAQTVINVNGEKCFDISTVANTFNSFFTTVAADLVRKLPSPFRLFTPDSGFLGMFYRSRRTPRDGFTLTPVSRLDILRQLSKLKVNKSTGLDGVSCRYLRDGAEVLADPVCHIINFSIMSEAVPSQFKKARVLPLFKKGSRLDPNNYRPVSILNCLSKILERAVHGQLVQYLGKHKVLYEFQSGFRSKYSTDTCLIHLTDFIRRELSRGRFVGMVLIDLAKAFDTVDFDVLLVKLGEMGIGSIDWFRSYLTGRTQCVKVNGTDSGFLDVTCGVPQGSILGPLLFLCYINDLSHCLSCHLSLYADDSALISSHGSIPELSRFLSGQLEICRKWLIDNKLSLHVGKTEAIVFSSKRKRNKTEGFQIMCGESLIKRVHSVRYLGVIIDECLSGEEHVLSIISKISGRIAFLYRSAYLLDFRTKHTLCSALIQPYFDYCCSSWYAGISAKLKDKLDVLQRRMVRYIFRMEPRDHVGHEHLKKLGWFSVPDRVRYFKLTHVYKVHKKCAPSYISDAFEYCNEIHSHNTRFSHANFFISKGDCVGQMSRSFLYSAAVEWNALPNHLKDSKSEKIFKPLLRSFLMNNY
jgi:hypothetical protein